jgi:hypothetical protein
MNHTSLPSTAPRCRRKVTNPKAPDHSSELSAWSSTSPRIGLPWRDAAPVSGAAAPCRVGSSPPQAASTVGSVTPATPSSSPRCDAQARKSRRPTNLDRCPFRPPTSDARSSRHDRYDGNGFAVIALRPRVSADGRRAARRSTGRSRQAPSAANRCLRSGRSRRVFVSPRTIRRRGGSNGGCMGEARPNRPSPREDAVGTDTDRRGGLAGPGKGPCDAQ